MTTAAAIIIGDEILSAKVRDANTPLLIDLFAELGVELQRIVVIGDDCATIAAEVASASAAYDVVITSGLGGVFPKGIRIGEITSVSDPGSGLLQIAKLAPAVDFGRLEQVFVMLRRGPTMELLYEDEEVDGSGMRVSEKASR